MRQITAQQLSSQLQNTEKGLTLLDVREPHEFAHCSIEGSINIPMNSIPARLNELDKDSEIVTICHHGMRSGAVAEFLVSRGFTQILNLQGGIDAWSTHVDPDVPRY